MTEITHEGIGILMDLDEWLRARISKAMESGLYRTQRIMNTAPSTRMLIDNKQQVVFSSHNYLGLANNQCLIYAAETILHEFGVGSSGTGITTGYTKWHQKLEGKIADFTQTEAVILFSNGALANVGVLSSVPDKEDIILSDRLNNVSIIDGCRLSEAATVVYNHIDTGDLREKLKESESFQRRFIVTEGVFCKDGSIAPLDEIMSLANQYDAYVIVNDTHATGTLGENGRGTSELFNVSPDILIGTFATAFGSEGGFVCGSQLLIDFLRNHAKSFIYQSSMPPAICAASYAAIEIVEKSNEKRETLLSNINHIKIGLGDMGFFVKGSLTPIIPVIIGDSYLTEKFMKRLQEEGVYTIAQRFPTTEIGESFIRLTVTSEHSLNEIDYLLRKFYLVGKELNII